MLEGLSQMYVPVESIPGGYNTHYVSSVKDEYKSALLNADSGIAFRYAGHQFGQYNPVLGDGRSAVVKHVSNGVIIVKGGLTTPLTRVGDGKLSLSAAAKEATTALYLSMLVESDLLWNQQTLAIGYKSKDDCRALIHRSTPFRIGSFQYAYNALNLEVVGSMWEDIKKTVGMADENNDDVFHYIVADYAQMCQIWHDIGFVHGCLNTDNLAAVAEGIDFGWSYTLQNIESEVKTPIDPYGWYSYENQSKAILFGLKQYFKCVETLLSNYTEEKLVSTFEAYYENKH